MTAPNVRPERQQTDESLAVERSKADSALREAETLVERKADLVVEHARDEADAVLSAARAKADEKLARLDSPDRAQAAIERERRFEDAVLGGERAGADAALRGERGASARVLARLLPLDREKTDQFLLVERARSDDTVANRDDFLGMVSHDLRNLLQSVVWNATIIEERAGDDEIGKSQLVGAQQIQRLASRMGRLLGDLVDVASIDAGKLVIEPTVGDAAGVVREARETWGSLASASGIALESTPGASMLATFDHERVLQILGNLITNALKFSPKGARVEIGLQQVGGAARFSVKDFGLGIPKDKFEAIFERFWQVGQNDHRGLGLGLYISRRLVDAHAGEIWVESEPGAGSTFYFTIPIAR